ncbi:hypothetical protein BT96DRAFT_881795 [Gymnopus androsaceus JB14]|uniref:Protein kinase domain-containing protein n=1 Tax=Gymnopus androsaceus JB14 TaxID=1447944 RepID=A0A6A4HPC8_9AGAR|nr:hypothetical protein BT96DRAFT_881795 [Gymnopus androsaceus JB14]
MPLPSVAELPAFLNTPLEESDKIVISQQLFDDSVSARPSDTCGKDDLSVVFKIGDVGLASVPFTRLLEGINSSRTEDGYHQFWDDNIRKALETLIPEGECIRNSNYDKETYNARPDFGFLITKRCVFRGPTSAGDPASELIQKLVWAHDSAPYILGYYANETVLTLVEIVHQVGHIRRIDLEAADLRLTVDRILNLRRLINMSTILRQLAGMVHNPSPEFELLERPNCNISFVSGKYVKKTYTCDNALDRVHHLKHIYQSLKEADVPNMDSLVSCEGNTAFLGPIGLATPPNTIGSLRDCILCILGALEKAHKIPIYHRDIRKENIIQSKDDPTTWFLIDWEDASTKPTFAQRHFARETHSPAVLEDNPSEIKDLGDRICRDSLTLTVLETRDLVIAAFLASTSA